MTLSSVIALVYSLFNRLSAALLLQAMKYTSAGGDVRDENDVDVMMMEYMTALMQQAERQGGRARSVSESSLKFHGGKGLPRLIVPLVICQQNNERAAQGNGSRLDAATPYWRQPDLHRHDPNPRPDHAP
jgi:hypothetical protein